MKVLIGTKNPGKIEAAKRAFMKYFDDVEVEGIKVSSDVPDEPLNEDILKGAKNRVNNLKEYAKENGIEADYYVSSEAGITNLLCDNWIDFNSACIESKEGYQSIGVSQGFVIPKKYEDEVINTDLGKVMDKVFESTDLGKTKGGISLLTKDVRSRIDIVEEAFIMALIQHINGDLWK